MTKPVVIRCAGGPLPGLEGKYLKAYDLEAREGRGDAIWTRDRCEALVFASMMTAFEAWRAQSVTVPLRDDDRPNRPLTAYTVTFEDAP
jgi:hypothetical protein